MLYLPTSSSRSALHWESSLQDWIWPSSPVPPCCCRVWCVSGLLLATKYFLLLLLLLSAKAGNSAAYVQPSGLQDRSWGWWWGQIVFLTCRHWVGCGPCVISWPQPAATGQGSGSHLYLTLYCHHQNDSCIKMISDETRFNGSFYLLPGSIQHC